MASVIISCAANSRWPTTLQRRFFRVAVEPQACRDLFHLVLLSSPKGLSSVGNNITRIGTECRPQLTAHWSDTAFSACGLKILCVHGGISTNTFHA